jgi:Cu2+-exporting ATPase
MRASSEAWRVLDDPAEWPAFGRVLEGDAGTGRWESQIAVEGMHCAACAFTVEAALLQVPGVLEAQVNAANHRARVVWSAAATRPSRWFEAAAAAGYPLLPRANVAQRSCGSRSGAGSSRAFA